MKHLSQARLKVAALLCAFGVGACDKPVVQVPTSKTELSSQFTEEADREEADNLLVVTPFSDNTFQLWESMKGELMDDLDVFTMEVDDQMDEPSLDGAVKKSSPSCVVLVGNRATRLYASYQSKHADAPPAVVLMASFAQEMVDQLRRGVGIAYEVPGVTSFVALRSLFDRPTHRVGVLYRPKLERFMKKQIELAQMEKVEVVPRMIEGKPGARKIRLALRQLLDAEKVDAVWVLNDNILLSESNLRGGWLPELRDTNLPVIVGVSSLVNSQLSFGSVAVVPDHEALGVQAANLIFDLWDEDWVIEKNTVKLPLSVQTVVDMNQAERLHLLPEARANIDRSVF